MPRWQRAALSLMAATLALLGAAGCMATQGSRDAAAGETRPASSGERGAPADGNAPSLAPADSSVRTVQLYAGKDERRLPVLALGAEDEDLTLEFDLMAREGRPLSVYFYHAGQNWERDAAPARFLDSFRSDDLLNFSSARARGVPYVHYTYRFPNRDVGFKASGNYILRVTEQGEEEEVLFERPFFVAEQTGALELRLDELRRGTQAGLSDRPVARYRIPPALDRSPFNFSACFVPDARLRQARCVERPEGGGSGRPLTFELPYRESFAPGTEQFFLDLSRLDPGAEIADVRRGRTPPEVILETDYADFAGAGRAPVVGRQPVVRGAGIVGADPALSAEYAAVRFRFVPPGERKLRGPLVLAGSFDAGDLGGAPRLRWNPDRGRYEGRVLLKQGLYTYRYASPDPALRRALAQSRRPARRRYAAFVYYRDATLGTDRLLRVRRTEAP